MPDDWIPNCGTQLERAIRALFVARGAATVDDCYISVENRERTVLATGITTIRANSSSHDPEASGNEKFTVSIQNKFAAIGDPTETNPKLNRTELDKRVGRQQLAMLRGNDDSDWPDLTCDEITSEGRALADIDEDNEADMSEFTCQFIRYLGMTRGEPEDDSCAWVEVRNFEITACSLNVD